MPLFLPQRWKKQPQGAVEIDWSNPISRDLFFAYLPGNPRNLAARQGQRDILSFTGHTDLFTGPSGKVSYYERYYFNNNYNTGPFTMGFPGQLYGTTRNVEDYFLADTGYYWYSSMLYQPSNNTYEYTGYITNSSYGVSAVVAIGLDAEPLRKRTRFLATTFESGFPVKAFLGSIQLGSGPSNWNGTMAIDTFITGFDASGGAADGGFANGGFIWRRVLSADELGRMDENPWQIFKPQKRVLYSPLFSYSRPNADSTPLQWSREPVGGTHFSAIDEVTSDPSDYLYALSTGLVDTMTCSPINLPSAGTSISVKYTTGASPISPIKIDLLEGTTVIKSSTVSAASGIITITSAEWASVSSWPWTPTLKLTSQ